jgi:hypothetical protein
VLAERVEVKAGLDDVRAGPGRGEVVQAGEVPLERDVLARGEDGEVGGVRGLCEVVERVLDLRCLSAPPSHSIQNRTSTQSPLNFARAPVLAFRKSKLCVRASARTEWGSLRSLSVRFPEFIRLTVSRRPLPSSHAAAGPVTDTASARCGKQKEKMPAHASVPVCWGRSVRGEAHRRRAWGGPAGGVAGEKKVEGGGADGGLAGVRLREEGYARVRGRRRHAEIWLQRAACARCAMSRPDGNARRRPREG